MGASEEAWLAVTAAHRGSSGWTCSAFASVPLTRSSALRPVLVGAAVTFTSRDLINPVEHRNAYTWGVRWLELVDRGFRPGATIAGWE